MVYYIVISILFGITAVLPLDYLGGIHVVKEMFGSSGEVVNFTTTSILVSVGVIMGLIYKYHWALINHFHGMVEYLGDKSNRSITRKNFNYAMALIAVAMINLLAQLYLGRLGYSLALDNRYIGVGLLISAIVILFGSMIKNGKNVKNALRISDGVVVGLVSILAIYPGISFLALAYLVLKIRKYELKLIVEFGYLALAVATFNYMITTFIQYGNSFSVMPSLVGSIAVMVIVAILTFFTTALYKQLVRRDLLAVVAIISFLAGVYLVFLG